MKVDPSTGAVEDGQWIDGSAPGATGITLAGGKVWITGSTSAPDVPFSPGVLAPANLGPGYLEGAYVSAVDFSAGVHTGPAIACVLDGGNLSHVGAVSTFRLISIFGANLGPEVGVAAPDGSSTSVAGVSIAFDGNPAQLLYVSASQINLAVPSPVLSQTATSLPVSTIMQVTVNGSILERQFPFAASSMNVFANLSASEIPCANSITATGFQPVAMNADGSMNSCKNPAAYGSTVSFFLHGAGGVGSPSSQLQNLQVLAGSCSAAVTNTSLIDDFVYKVDVSLPATLLPCDEDFGVGQGENFIPVTFTSYNGAPVGPLFVPANLAGPVLNFSPPGQPMQMVVWAK